MASRDGHVRVLPLHVANKIAAGEVVERPASVVKELVENALDAGAKTVKVSVLKGGSKLVSVSDDGCGMSRDDALLSLERQATSKILDVDDIENISTLGFRGEAIPSIASVSRFSMTTRRRESDEGVRIAVDAGVLGEVSAAGCPPGTTVEVRDLFCNVPARRKFLRAAATEENHIKRIFSDYALSRPETGFSLFFDGREAFRLAPAHSVAERMGEIIGRDTAENMLPMDSGDVEGVRVTGFVERPDLGTPFRHEQYIFINSRAATTAQISYALKETYPKKSTDFRPALVMFVDVSPRMVDVNVHPAKREVRFRNAAAVKEAVRRAVLSAISPAVRPEGVSVAHTTGSGHGCRSLAGASGQVAAAAPASACDAVAEPPAAVATAAEPVSAPEPQPVQRRFDEEIPAGFDMPGEGEKAFLWKRFKFLAQTATGFIIVETDEGLVIVNPKAARERIAYETLSKRKDGEVPSQTLLMPESVRLSPADAGRVSELLPEISAAGFSIEPFGKDTFKIDAVPVLAADSDLASLLSTIAQDFSGSSARRAGMDWRGELIAKSVAKFSAGMSTKLDENGAVRLVNELCACRMPYVSPRGKPVMIFTSTRELDRKFGNR